MGAAVKNPPQALQRGWVLVLLGAFVMGALAFGTWQVTLYQPEAPRIWQRGSIRARDGTLMAATLASGQRAYPLGVSAGQVLGYAERSPWGSGLAGVEYWFDSQLSQGEPVELTIDPFLQTKAEKALAEAAREHQPLWASAVVLGRQGQVLALANYPFFDPAEPRHPDDPKTKNQASQSLFEPGSSLKPLWAAALLEEGLAGLDSEVNSQSPRIVEGKAITDATTHPPVLTMAQVLAYSSNVGMSRLLERLPRERAYHYLGEFGLTQALALEGAFNETPLVAPPSSWNAFDFAALAFGQGLAITPLQLAAAFASLGDGQYYKPYLLAGGAVDARPVFSSGTSQKIRDSLAASTAPAAQIAGYSVAGKSGTAQVAGPDGYLPDEFASVYAAVFPAEQPLVTVAVVIFQPQGSFFGSAVAAPVFRDIALAVLAQAKK